MKDLNLREQMSMPQPTFPIKHLVSKRKTKGLAIGSHWHEQMELLLFRKGEAHVQCDKNSFIAKKNTLVVVNCNDIHSCDSLSDELYYDCIIIDMSLLGSGLFDNAQIKYITPILQNTILFKNNICKDSEINNCIDSIINEYERKDFGYELAIKSSVFKLFTLLLRNHVNKVLTPQECDLRIRNLDRFKTVLEHIENNFSQKITIEEISQIARLSPFYFCRLFKETTGKSFVDYINSLRVEKASDLLKNSSLNITETALSCGFDDINYFSKIFKKYKGISPSKVKITDSKT